MNNFNFFTDKYCKNKMIFSDRTKKSNILKKDNISIKMRMGRALSVGGSSKRIISRMAFQVCEKK